MSDGFRRWACLLALGILALVPGCERAERPEDEPGESERLRVVTLAPALTQMIVDLGHGDLLVGVTDKDTAAPPDLPVVGNFVDLDSERLLSVRPTHVLQMVPKSGISPGLASLAEQAGFTVVGYPYPYSIQDVLDTLHGGLGGAAGVGEVIGDPQRAAAVSQALRGFFAGMDRLVAEHDRPRVLLAIGTNPLMASGPGSVLDELLRHAGGLNVAAGASVSAPTYDREALLAANPQVVLVLSPGRQSVDAQAMASLLPELQQLPIDAVRDSRVVLINDPATLLPSTSLPRIAAIMARSVHPELSGEVNRLLEAYEAVLAEREAAREPASR